MSKASEDKAKEKERKPMEKSAIRSNVPTIAAKHYLRSSDGLEMLRISSSMTLVSRIASTQAAVTVDELLFSWMNNV